MKWLTLNFVCFSLILIFSNSLLSAETPDGCLSKKQKSLADEINKYRVSNGLGELPISVSLSLVAQWHVVDLYTNDPDATGQCNLHSWSDTKPSLWTPVCYTDDHANASEMWNKPVQITNGMYRSSGFEIVYKSNDEVVPARAVAFWENSSSHRSIVLERGEWAGKSFAALGAGIYKNFASIWFGKKADPQSFPPTCP